MVFWVDRRPATRESRRWAPLLGETPRFLFASLRPLPALDVELRAALDAPVAVVVTVLAAAGVTGADAIHLVRAFRAATDGFALIELSGSFQLPEDIDESFQRMIAALIAGSGLANPAEATAPAT